MQAEKLAYMANQIATFFNSQPGDDGPERIAAHLRDFWGPEMRAHLREIAEAGSDAQGSDERGSDAQGSDEQGSAVPVLDPNVRKAVQLLS